jgi:cation diffusion facilitator family transporter
MNQPDYMWRAVRFSLAGNVVLFLIKLWAVFTIDSLAVAADLGVSTVSLGISLLLFYAIRMSNKPADFFHNYGYGKIENVCEAIEGVVLIGIAMAISFQAILNLVRPESVGSPWVGLAAGGTGVVVNFYGAHYILRLGKMSRSPAISAEGLHYRLEGYISLAVTASFVIALILERAGMRGLEQYVDPVATIVVSVLIAVPSVKLAKHAFMKLLDASIEEESKMDVIKVLSKHFHNYCDFKDLRTRSAGRKKFIELKLVLPEHINFKNGHKIAYALEADIRESIPDSDVLVKMEPCTGDCAFAQRKDNCPYLHNK